ncbi:MAG: acyltransferase [Acidimicrobiales bacterium]
MLVLSLIALCPSRLKPPLYRVMFGYRIGHNVRIGLSLIDAERCEIDDDVEIGHLNVVTRVKHLTIGAHTRIGFLNVIRGGDEVTLGSYAEIARMNEINSIPNPRVVNACQPRFILGTGSAVTAGHKIDFTDRVEIGRRTVLGGRNSSLWTHNRQRTAPLSIGSCSYVGSDICMAPGSAIPSRCMVGMGAVVVHSLREEGSFIAGVPARVVRPLEADDEPLLNWQWRDDLPPEL